MHILELYQLYIMFRYIRDYENINNRQSFTIKEVKILGTVKFDL